MTPTTLRNRKRYLMRQKRKTERRRLIAQRACTSTSNDSPASSNSDSMDTLDDEMSEDEQSVSNLGDSVDIKEIYLQTKVSTSGNPNRRSYGLDELVDILPK